MPRSADPVALAAWRRTVAERPTAAAVSVDGEHWWSRADLLDRVAAVPRISEAGPDDGPTGVRVVPDDDPATALVTLLAALVHDEVAVLASPATLPAVLDAVVAAVSQQRIGAGRLVVATSGTTGRPRAVVRTWPSWTRSFGAFDAVLRPVDGDVMWLPGPVLATLTLFGLCHSALTGLPVVATGRWRTGAPAPEAASLMHALPAVLADVLDRRGVAPRLRRAVVAGAAGTARLRPGAAERGVEVVEYYGAAELSFVGLDGDGRGFEPYPSVDVELRGEKVWVRSPFTALGYLSAPSLDPAAPLRQDGDGWSSVGDRATPTGTGRRFVLLGRPDAAVVGGHTVVLADVEAVLATVAGVRDVACSSAADTVLGEQVVAHLAVGRPPAADPTAGAMLRRRARAAVRTQLPHARALRLHLVEALPRTAAGKVDRVALAAATDPAAGPHLP